MRYETINVTYSDKTKWYKNYPKSKSTLNVCINKLRKIFVFKVTIWIF